MTTRLLVSLTCTVVLVAQGAPAMAEEYVAYAVTKKGDLALPKSLDGVADEELIQVRWGTFSGSQVRVAVLEVDNNSITNSFKVAGPGGEVYTYNISDLENQVPVNGIESMVTDVLNRSGRFRLVERQALGQVLGEQDLAASGRVSQPSGAKIGKVLGAQYLVQAVVTSYEPNFKGKKVGLGAFAGGILGGAKVGKQRSMVGMNFRLIDAETSEITFTKQVDVVVSSSELDFGGAAWAGIGAIGGLYSSFSKTPVGQAVMAGVNIGAYELVKQIGATPTRGSVIKVDEGKVYLNLGSDAVSVGDQLKAISKGEELIDPDTGLSLGGEDEEIGTLKVASVQEKFSIAEAADFDASKLNRGDEVVSSRPPAPLNFAAAWQGKPKKQ